jgi:hypothetical protein
MVVSKRIKAFLRKYKPNTIGILILRAYVTALTKHFEVDQILTLTTHAQKVFFDT